MADTPAQRARDAGFPIGDFSTTPSTTTFNEMNATLTSVLDGRCFKSIKNIATEAGGTFADVVARPPPDPSNPLGFLAWLAALFDPELTPTLARPLVLLSYASYVSSENPDLFIHALYCLYYAEIGDTGDLTIGDYESVMGAWDTFDHINGQIAPITKTGPNSFQGLMSAMSVPTAEGGAGRSLALSFPGDLTIDPTADESPEPNTNWNNTPCADPIRPDPPDPLIPIVVPPIPIIINPPGLLPIHILPGPTVDPGGDPGDGPGPAPPGHHRGGGGDDDGGGGGGGDGDYVPPPPKGRPEEKPPGPTEGGSNGILLLLLIIVVIGIVASQRR